MEAVQTGRITTDEYARMAAAGVITERDRVELIDGEIVPKMSLGSRHCACTDRATRLLVQALGDRAIVRLGGSVRLGLFSEPEPDVVLLKPRPDFYASNHPSAADVFLMIEVADSSLQFDREVKAAVYAAADVPEFWLVDLISSTIFRSTDPHGRAYARVDTSRRGDVVAPRLLPTCRIAVSELLPD